MDAINNGYRAQALRVVAELIDIEGRNPMQLVAAIRAHVERTWGGNSTVSDEGSQPGGLGDQLTLIGA